MSADSLTEPTLLAPSSTGSCETPCWLMSLSACRTAAPGATLTTGGSPSPLAPSTSPSEPRSASSIWFSRIHSSLYSLER